MPTLSKREYAISVKNVKGNALIIPRKGLLEKTNAEIIDKLIEERFGSIIKRGDAKDIYGDINGVTVTPEEIVIILNEGIDDKIKNNILKVIGDSNV